MNTSNFLKIFGNKSSLSTSVVNLNSIESKFVTNSNFNYTTARNAVNGNGIGNNVLIESRTSTSVGFAIRRTTQLFDLSTIIGNITAANLYITIYNNCFKLSLQESLNTSTLVLSDYSNFDSTLLGTGNILVDGSPKIMKVIFNSSGISKLNQKNLMRFILRDYDKDYINSQPTLESFSTISTEIPYLELTVES